MDRAILTVDVEDWYMTSDLDIPVARWGGYERRVQANTNLILDVLAERNIKGTFFTLACVAKEYPSLVMRIVQEGHELASHGTWHQMLTRLSRNEIREDIRKSKSILEDISGQQVTSYRAPSWSISSRNYDVLEILEELGFLIDSSLQPFSTPLSGVGGAPTQPFRPALGGRTLEIIEVPSTVLNFRPNIRVPFSGGLYMRLWPKMLLPCFFQHAMLKGHAMLYIHPWEFDPDQPVVVKSMLTQFTHYYNLSANMDKLRKILDFVPFGRMRDIIARDLLPVIELS